MPNPAPRHRSPNNFLTDLFLRALGLCLQPNIISWKNRLTGILLNVKLRLLSVRPSAKTASPPANSTLFELCSTLLPY
ncbi:MAG: hypothetical protein MRQ05_05590 [Candidatus Midichloria mitochondrii]|uniref:hypothetical protein n=1 Tax=Candidatus Midichloria mitochondrii TaxID=234827 RepID=UPI001F282833|nr:hypothetical protein [Candidatus Midichloria mitochondrii]MDJ1313563.1 hypothetical protein [Candidatus Midichloria mitochondrii]